MDICNISKECRSKAELLVKCCMEKELKLTTAESCTGGLISAFITSVSGSSAVFDGALVSYANNIKTSLLGVSEETVKNDGVVSESCVRQMAEGAMRLFSADIAIAVSGIAGPTGATPGKPVGTVYICARHGAHCVSRRYNFDGDRDKVRVSSALEALNMTLSLLDTE